MQDVIDWAVNFSCKSVPLRKSMNEMAGFRWLWIIFRDVNFSFEAIPLQTFGGSRNQSNQCDQITMLFFKYLAI